MIMIQEIADFNFNLPERVGSTGNLFYYIAITHWNSLSNDTVRPRKKRNREVSMFYHNLITTHE